MIFGLGGPNALTPEGKRALRIAVLDPRLRGEPEEVLAPRGIEVALVPRSSEALFGLPLQEARRRIVERFEKAYLAHLLGETRGSVGETARRAKVNPRTLYEKMRRYGLRKEEFRETSRA